MHRRTRVGRAFLAAAAIPAILIAAASAAPASANTIDFLSWDHDEDGATVVTIVCDDEIDSAAIRSYRLDDPPREVVVLGGIESAPDHAELRIDDGRVLGLRLVHHSDRSPRELLVVIDLGTDAAGITSIRHDGERIAVTIGPRPAPIPEAPVPAAPSTQSSMTPTVGAEPILEPTETPVAPTPTDTATPTETRTPFPTATPTSPPAETAMPEPTQPPGYPDRPAPPVLPPVPTHPSPTVPSGSGFSNQPPIDATPTPDPDPAQASRVIDIAASSRGDGSTLLRITADGKIPLGDARYLEVAADPPRVVVTIRGVSAPDLPRSIDLDDPVIRRVRLIHDAETIEGELHMVLHLAVPGTVTTMNQVGPHLVIQLSPSSPGRLSSD